MRLGVFLPFLVIAFATASPPAVAQLFPPPVPDVERPAKEEKPAKKEKPAKDEKPPKEGEEGSPVDGEEGSPGNDEEGSPGDEEGGNDEEGETGGDSGGGGSGGDSAPGGQDPAGLDQSTNGSGSADEGGPSFVVSDAGCLEECDLSRALTDGGEGDAILSANRAEAAGEFEDEGVALSASATADASPALLLALFALMTLGLLVGLAGGLRALYGRIRRG
jgi:hypothetical protein